MRYQMCPDMDVLVFMLMVQSVSKISGTVTSVGKSQITDMEQRVAAKFAETIDGETTIERARRILRWAVDESQEMLDAVEAQA